MKNQMKNANFPKTDDGRVYYIGLKRGEVANRILVVEDPESARKMAELLDRTPKPFIFESNKGFLTITGRYKNVPVSIVSIIMGGVMMDFFIREVRQIITGEIIIIRFGSCGSIGTPTIGNILVPYGAFSVTRNYDYFIHGVDTNDAMPIVDSPYYISKVAYADEELNHLLLSELSAAFYPSLIYTCLSACSDSFYSSQGRIDPYFLDDNQDLIPSIFEKYDDAHIVDMQSFMLFHLANTCRYTYYSKDHEKPRNNNNNNNNNNRHSIINPQQFKNIKEGNSVLYNLMMNNSQSSFLKYSTSRSNYSETHSNTTHPNYPYKHTSNSSSTHSLPPKSAKPTLYYQNKNTSVCNVVKPNSHIFGNEGNEFMNGAKSQIKVTTTTTTTTTTATNQSGINDNWNINNHNQNKFNNNNNNNMKSKNKTGIKTSTAMIVYCDRSTNNFISPDLVNYLEPICGEAIFNTLIKVQVDNEMNGEECVWYVSNEKEKFSFGRIISGERNGKKKGRFSNLGNLGNFSNLSSGRFNNSRKSVDIKYDEIKCSKENFYYDVKSNYRSPNLPINNEKIDEKSSGKLAKAVTRMLSKKRKKKDLVDA
ncbi:nucleoside phosphorylase domain-containing protein [Gigaspora rosea]|uniref:Nucleoside phosphorylase domain-containing protein n=1 Tax=Gigaspora rosea TaxID=44941 RepID=A0A397VZP0_9GLOM|nr:nucleoside phosphorylase domain-containing protein [Gigaspora rosea]